MEHDPAPGAERSVMDPYRVEVAAWTPPPGHVERRSRWAASQTTFGPVGRLVVTALLLVPVWWMWEMSVISWPGLVIYVTTLLPWALRDVWRSARRRSG